MSIQCCDCDCELFEFTHADGSKTLQLQDASVVIEAHNALRTSGAHYWSIHYRGRHVLTVEPLWPVIQQWSQNETTKRMARVKYWLIRLASSH